MNFVDHRITKTALSDDVDLQQDYTLPKSERKKKQFQASKRYFFNVSLKKIGNTPEHKIFGKCGIFPGTLTVMTISFMVLNLNQTKYYHL